MTQLALEAATAPLLIGGLVNLRRRTVEARHCTDDVMSRDALTGTGTKLKNTARDTGLVNLLSTFTIGYVQNGVT